MLNEIVESNTTVKSEQTIATVATTFYWKLGVGGLRRGGHGRAIMSVELGSSWNKVLCQGQDQQQLHSHLALELIREAASRVKFHVVLQGVASVEPFWAKVARERHLSTVDESVLFQVVLHPEPLGTLGTCEGSGGVLGGRVVLVRAVGGGVNLV